MIIKIIVISILIAFPCILCFMAGVYSGHKCGIAKGKIEGWCSYEDLVFRRMISEPRYNKNKVQKDFLK